MINSKAELSEYIRTDMLANWRSSARPKLFGDEQWKYLLAMRKLEYFGKFCGIRKMVHILPIAFYKFRYHRLGILCGYTIPLGTCGKGLALPHRGSIVINSNFAYRFYLCTLKIQYLAGIRLSKFYPLPYAA